MRWEGSAGVLSPNLRLTLTPQLSLGKSLDFPISALSSKNRADDPKSVSAVTKQGWRKYRTTLGKRIKLSWELSRKRIMGGEKAAAKLLRRGNTRYVCRVPFASAEPFHLNQRGLIPASAPSAQGGR